MKPTASNNTHSFLNACLCLVTALILCACSSALGADGFANVNGTTTGGQGIEVMTVDDFASFTRAVRWPRRLVILVQGTINLGSTNVDVTRNKTIVGMGTNAVLIGNLRMAGVSNIIIQNITFTNLTGISNEVTHVFVPISDILNGSSRASGDGVGAGGGDGLTIVAGAHHVWVDHCTFSDCADGQLDITKASDYVTVSWCKFLYSITNNTHRFSNLVGAADTDTDDRGKLHVTYHDNWWSTLCDQRMPRVRYGEVHSYNNYYDCPGNLYCIGVGNDSQILAENNSFFHVNLPWRNMSTTNHQGLIHWNANVFDATTIPTWAANSTVFTPPYAYTPDNADAVKSIVTARAGSGKLVTAIEDGGDGSLRQAVAQAPLDSIITFAQDLSGKTIFLRRGTILLDKNLTIDGSALPLGITIKDYAKARVFEVRNVARLVSLTISSVSQGGGIYNSGTLTVNNCTVAGNSAGPTGFGGGIYSSGVLTVNNSIIEGNRADFCGGGIINFGTLTMNGTTITNNISKDFSSGSGGGICNWGSTAKFNQSRSTITNNHPDNIYNRP